MTRFGKLPESFRKASGLRPSMMPSAITAARFLAPSVDGHCYPREYLYFTFSRSFFVGRCFSFSQHPNPAPLNHSGIEDVSAVFTAVGCVWAISVIAPWDEPSTLRQIEVSLCLLAQIKGSAMIGLIGTVDVESGSGVTARRKRLREFG